MFFKSTVLVVALLALSVRGKPYGDDNNDLYSNDDYEDLDGGDGYGEEEKVIVVLPKFKTKPQNMMVNEGGTIRLPCLVDNIKGFVIMWKKGEDIITVNKQVVVPSFKKRFSLNEVDNGNELVISLAEEQDAADWTCQVSSFKTLELKHNVQIRVRPEVEPTPSNGIIVAKTGDSVTLSCQVTKGSPVPEVQWRRKEGRKMPDGAATKKGLSMTFSKVTRHNSGIYLCEANNGFGEPSVAEIKLDVQHRPEIEQEETFIHTREGDQTEVICVVHSSPRANVSWFKNGAPLEQTRANQVNQIGNRHTLSLPITGRDSFGEYTCRASNTYGTSQKTTEVSGKAKPAVIKSDSKGSEGSRFHLEWTADSFSPINKFKVEFKEISEDVWTVDETSAIKLPHEEKGFQGSYVIPRLRPATHYQARVSSENTYGFSNPSQVFQFATKGAPEHRPLNGGVASSNTAVTLTTLAAVALAVML